MKGISLAGMLGMFILFSRFAKARLADASGRLKEEEGMSMYVFGVSQWCVRAVCTRYICPDLTGVRRARTGVLLAAVGYIKQTRIMT